MARKFFTVTVGITALLALSACEHVDQLSWKGSPAKVTDAKTGQPENQGGPVIPSVERAPVTANTEPGHNFPPPNERDLMVISNKLAGGSIEIFDLDSGRSYGGGASAGSDMMVVSSAASGGMPSSSDSSVTVFPVDGGSLYPGQMGSWPNSVLPTTGGSMPGGRVSPRVGTGYTPSQIFFKHGSSRLGNGDKQMLRQVAEQAKFSPVERVSVEGFASTRTGVSDPVEAKIVNLKQSMNRAFSVSSQLMRSGVPAEKIKTTVWGDTKNEGVSEAQSRRVDVVTGGQ